MEAIGQPGRYPRGRLARHAIDKLARAIDPRQHERIVDGPGFNQIDRTSQKLLQSLGKTKKLLEGRQATVARKFHQEVDVACERIEIGRACGRSEDFQACDIEPSAEPDHFLFLLGDFHMHRRLLIDSAPSNGLAKGASDRPGHTANQPD
jgi:hypothetical protein